jgi:formylglycine-generating enzyme required for sulfatase activity
MNRGTGRALKNKPLGTSASSAPLRFSLSASPARCSTIVIAVATLACSKATPSPIASPLAATANASSSGNAMVAPSSVAPPAPSGSGSESADAAVAIVETPDAGLAAAPPEMLLVPAGPFTMGANEGGEGDEHPAHTVTLGAFFLDRTEVTNAAWGECVAAKVCRPKSDAVRTKHPDFNGPSQPVSGISWDDAVAYCGWRGKRLPREAEFEKAARDTDDRRFAWGNDPPTHERTVFSSGHPEDVGTHPAGRGPYGQDDLAGNVWEWMQDEYDPYAYRRPGAQDGGAGTPGTCAEITAAQDELRRTRQQGFTGTNPIPTECEHSIRGGAYNYDPHGLRATNRVHHPGRFRIPMLGLRCAKDAR